MSEMAIGIDIGGTDLKAVRWDGRAVQERLTIPTPPTAQIVDSVATLVSDRWPDPVGMGVAVAGLVDRTTGKLKWGPHLQGDSIDIEGPLGDRLGIPVQVDNDNDAAALAEFSVGAAAEANDGIFVGLGTGIGMGIIVNGVVYRGGGAAGEVGHMTVEPGGRPCVCGRFGCWETVVSGWSLAAGTAARATAAPVEGLPSDRGGEDDRSVDEAVSWFAAGCETLALALDPPVIVVGGALGLALGDRLVPAVVDRLNRTEGALHRAPPDVRSGTLGAYAGAIGAAIAVAGMS